MMVVSFSHVKGIFSACFQCKSSHGEFWWIQCQCKSSLAWSYIRLWGTQVQWRQAHTWGAHTQPHPRKHRRSDAGKLNSVIRCNSECRPQRAKGQQVEQTLAASWNGNRRENGGEWCERFEALAVDRKCVWGCIVSICWPCIWPRMWYTDQSTGSEQIPSIIAEWDISL